MGRTHEDDAAGEKGSRPQVKQLEFGFRMWPWKLGLKFCGKESRLVWKALIKKAGLQTLRAQCALRRLYGLATLSLLQCYNY